MSSSMLQFSGWRTAVVPARRHDLDQSVVEYETLLYDPATGGIHDLNETARLVWDQCDGRTIVDQIALSQAERYGIEYETALDHVEQVVTMFASVKLLNVVAPE